MGPCAEDALPALLVATYVLGAMPMRSGDWRAPINRGLGIKAGAAQGPPTEDSWLGARLAYKLLAGA